MGSKENLTRQLKQNVNPFGLSDLRTTGTLTPPTVVADRALGNILIGLQSIGVFAVAGSGMSRDGLPNEVRVIKNPGLTRVGRWNDIDQVDRRPREVSVSDQDGTHRHPQIVSDQLFRIENDHHVVLTCKPPGARFRLSNGGKAVKFE